MMSFFEKYGDVLDVVVDVLGLVAGLLTVALHAGKLLNTLEERWTARVLEDEYSDYAD